MLSANHRIFFLQVTLSLIGFSTTLSAQAQYKVGDIVEDFTLINRANNQPVSLYDLEGKVIFLEWFAHWCPFCQAAAADIGPGIVQYYNQRSGNDQGVPVMHVGLNLQGGQESQTQQFVDFFGLDVVLNDFDRGVASRFQFGGQPIFAIINGVENSPGKQQWELLYTALGYGSLDAPITSFRTAIDSVLAAEVPTNPLDDYLSSQGVPEGSRGPQDDPDRDGVPNVIEFLNRTNANSSSQARYLMNRVIIEGGKRYLGIEWVVDPNVTSFALAPEFSFDLSFAEAIPSIAVSDTVIEGGLILKVARSSTELINGSTFARLKATEL